MKNLRRCLPTNAKLFKGVALGALGLARWEKIDDRHTTAGFGACLLIVQALIPEQRLARPSAASDEPYAFAMQTLLRPGCRHGKELLHLQCYLYHALRLTGLPSLDSAFIVSHRHHSTAANEEHLLVRKEAGLGRITINRPKALNAKNCGAPSNKNLSRQSAV